jgi:hypothetical protein
MQELSAQMQRGQKERAIPTFWVGRRTFDGAPPEGALCNLLFEISRIAVSKTKRTGRAALAARFSSSACGFSAISKENWA